MDRSASQHSPAPARRPPLRRESAGDALRQRLGAAIAAADPARPPGAAVNKTALFKLSVDVLRQELEEENADSRGNKEVLVGRLLGLLAERARQDAEVLPGLQEFGEG